MQKHMLMTCLMLLVFPSVVMGQETESPSNGDHLTPMAYLVGGTWIAEGEVSGFGKYTAERSYHWVLGRKFIEQRHVMKLPDNELETKGIIGWDPDKKAIVAWGFGSDGGFVTSWSDAVSEDQVCLEGVRVGEFNAGPIRATFRKVNDNEFLETAEIKKGGDWVSMFTFRFQRK